MDLSNEALAWVKEHQKEIIEKFAGGYPSAIDKPLSIFMAGSPGAGKTEFSKELLRALRLTVARIDPDEIRNILPQYTPGNAHLFQAAVSVAVEKIHDYVLRERKDFLLDGTFSNFEKARDNVRRSINKNREILIAYVFQDPLVAWDFTVKREEVEGRNIPKEKFIEELFASYRNVNLIKQEFGSQVNMDVVERNILTTEYRWSFDVSSVEERVQIGYTKEDLEKRL
jgi:UDP-N-acetylglucosamine kinase